MVHFASGSNFFQIEILTLLLCGVVLFRWGLTALNFHYESQCIPTPLAWYAHQLPEWFQKISVVGTYFIEMGVPFLFFAPVRSLRMFAFWCQVSVLVPSFAHEFVHFSVKGTLSLSLVYLRYVYGICLEFLISKTCYTKNQHPQKKQYFYENVIVSDSLWLLVLGVPECLLSLAIQILFGF